jgi:hypothetical protein
MRERTSLLEFGVDSAGCRVQNRVQQDLCLVEDFQSWRYKQVWRQLRTLAAREKRQQRKVTFCLCCNSPKTEGRGQASKFNRMIQ